MPTAPVDRGCARCGEPVDRRQARYCGDRCKERARYERHRDSRLEACKAYRRREREAISARRRARYASAPPRERKPLAGEAAAKAAERARANYLRNRDARAAANAEAYRRRRQADPEAMRAQGRIYAAERRARVRAASTYAVTKGDLVALLRRHGGRCAYCLTAPAEHLDHVIPLARGGSHGIGNLAPACARCNRSKSDRLLVEWRHHRPGPRARKERH